MSPHQRAILTNKIQYLKDHSFQSYLHYTSAPGHSCQVIRSFLPVLPILPTCTLPSEAGVMDFLPPLIFSPHIPILRPRRWSGVNACHLHADLSLQSCFHWHIPTDVWLSMNCLPQSTCRDLTRGTGRLHLPILLDITNHIAMNRLSRPICHMPSKG